MSRSSNNLAHKYFVDDLYDASLSGSRLHSVLKVIDSDSGIDMRLLKFLDNKGLTALRKLAYGGLNFDEFSRLAKSEKNARPKKNPEQVKKQAKSLEARILRDRYGLDYVDSGYYPRVMELLRHIDAGHRLSPEEVIWLSTQAEECWTPELRKAHHRLEAEFFAAKWRKDHDPWDAVTASGHWRKAEVPKDALAVTKAALAIADLQAKLHSALCTTRGGAMRDLRRRSEARDLGHNAHKLSPGDFRPCTLLGAIHMELGEFSTGQEWYEKAEKRGAKTRSIDQDLRGILNSATPEERKKLCDFLLSHDQNRFAWVG